MEDDALKLVKVLAGGPALSKVRVDKASIPAHVVPGKPSQRSRGKVEKRGGRRLIGASSKDRGDHRSREEGGGWTWGQGRRADMGAQGRGVA
eukprot:351732-Chlamydomonas_euryale.AAC.22